MNTFQQADRERRVEMLVRAEWHALVRRRVRRRRATWLTGAALAAGVMLFIHSAPTPAGGHVQATVAAAPAPSYAAAHAAASVRANAIAHDDAVPGFNRVAYTLETR
jgi:hypothetical protein